MKHRTDDPMQLWVGSWVPEDVIDREARRLADRRQGDGRERADDEPSR